MTQVLITVVIAFLFLQLVASQVPDAACQNALNELAAANNNDSCRVTSDSICSGQCRTYYQNVIDLCPRELSVGVEQTLNTVCGGVNGAGVMKGLGIYSLLLLSVIAAVIF